VTPRVKTELWVKALIRRAEIEGGQAMLVRRGDVDAGSVLLVLNGCAGKSRLLSAASRVDGTRVWLMVSGPDAVPDAELAADIATRLSRDPDLWVVEIEDRAYRAFVDDPIEIVTPSSGGVRNPATPRPGPHR